MGWTDGQALVRYGGRFGRRPGRRLGLPADSAVKEYLAFYLFDDKDAPGRSVAAPAGRLYPHKSNTANERLADFHTDVLVLGVIRQANAFPFQQLWQQCGKRHGWLPCLLL